MNFCVKNGGDLLLKFLKEIKEVDIINENEFYNLDENLKLNRDLKFKINGVNYKIEWFINECYITIGGNELSPRSIFKMIEIVTWDCNFKLALKFGKITEKNLGRDFLVTNLTIPLIK